MGADITLHVCVCVFVAVHGLLNLKIHYVTHQYGTV